MSARAQCESETTPGGEGCVNFGPGASLPEPKESHIVGLGNVVTDGGPDSVIYSLGRKPRCSDFAIVA